jgi:hypothetical protein
MVRWLKYVFRMIGLLPLLPLLSSLTFPEVVNETRVAQVRLAETLAEADAIESVTAHGREITFVIVRDGDTFEVTARTTKRGDITALAIAPVRAVPVALHGLTWLGAELAEVTAVTRLVVDADGAVTLATNDGRRYMAIPGRGSGGANVAAEARWAAAWSSGS